MCSPLRNDNEERLIKAINALITAMGYHAENIYRQSIGESPAYSEGEFFTLVEQNESI